MYVCQVFLNWINHLLLRNGGIIRWRCSWQSSRQGFLERLLCQVWPKRCVGQVCLRHYTFLPQFSQMSSWENENSFIQSLPDWNYYPGKAIKQIVLEKSSIFHSPIVQILVTFWHHGTSWSLPMPFITACSVWLRRATLQCSRDADVVDVHRFTLTWSWFVIHCLFVSLSYLFFHCRFI